MSENNNNTMSSMLDSLEILAESPDDGKIVLAFGDLPQKLDTWLTGAEDTLSEVDETLGDLTELREDMARAVEAAVDAKDDAETQAANAEAWAVGTRGGTDVSTEDETYHNNSKYYAEQTSTGVAAAAASASAAATSAGAAAGSASDAASSANESAVSAAAASASATAASSSQTSAASSATAAAASQTAAAASETSASNSAASASSSATSASGSATAAAASASAAAQSAQDAEDVLDSIPPDYTTTVQEVTELKSALTSTVDEIANYPAKTDVINITSTDFVQGYRHNQSGASIKNDSGYTTTKNVIQFKKGDIFTHPTDQGIIYYFVTTAGAFYKTYVPSPYTVPEDIDLYLDCGKSGITPQTTPTVQYTKKTIIEKIVEKDESLQAQIDKLKTNFPELEECYKQGDASVKQGYKLVDGVVTSTSATWLCCTENFMECKTGDIFLILQCYDIARYTDSDAASYVSTVAVANLPLYSGNERWNVWVADLDGYVRFTLYWSTPVECAVTRLNLSDHPYTCVCLGDSIFGNNQKPNDLPTYMQKVDGLMTANCGFGGTEAATHFNQIYTPLSFWEIADAINSGDWSDIDVDWNAINNDHVFMANVYILCHLVDWSKVQTITVAYGTNDWNAGVSIDNESNSKDVTTYKGALRYGIEKIQSAYPKINIVLLSPLYRYWSNSQDYSAVDDDSDNRVNGGHKLSEFVDAMKEVAEEYHIPFFDNYNTAGINKFTAPSILRDGTHLNYKYGVSMVGKHLGAEVALSNRAIADSN